MIRATLQECIELFYSNETCKERAIRGMEQLSEWDIARKYWLLLGRTSDAEACKLLSDAISQGDEYRAAVKHLNDWVDQTVESGIMSKEDAVKQIYPEMSRIYNQNFRN